MKKEMYLKLKGSTTKYFYKSSMNHMTFMDFGESWERTQLIFFIIKKKTKSIVLEKGKQILIFPFVFVETMVELYQPWRTGGLLHFDIPRVSK